ncbi:hypothetical protein P9112_002095 [Eukaryota sp. TZLM1-RC]
MLEPHRFEWLGSMAQNTISVSSSGAYHSVAFGLWRGRGRFYLGLQGMFSIPSGFVVVKFPSGSLISQGFSYIRGPTFVWTFYLRTRAPASKWRLAGTALLLS